MRLARARLQESGEAVRVAQFQDRRRHDRNHDRLLDAAHQRPESPARNRLRPVLRPRPVLPVLQLDEHHRHVLALTGEREADDRKQRVDILGLGLAPVALDLLDDLFRLGRGGARGSLDQRHQHALILVGQEGGGGAQIKRPHRRHQTGIDDQPLERIGDDPAGQAAIAIRQPPEAGLEMAAEPVRKTALGFGMGLQDRGAKRGGEDQRHQHRKHHGRNDGDRELFVDFARRAAKEGHRHEDGRQHQRDADQRAGDFPHRFPRRLARGKVLLGHDPLDVLDDDDGVIDQKPDGENHGQHGQRVDREAEGRHDAKGAQKHHRHRQRRDQRRAQIVQEDQHDQHHQHDRLEQGLDHLLDRQRDKRRRVIGDDIVHPRGEIGRQFRQPLLDQLRRIERIGPRGQLNRHPGRGGAVVKRIDVIGFRAKLDPGDIAQQHQPAIGIGAQDDALEILGRLEQRLRGDCRVQHLPLGRGQRPERPGRDLRILPLHRGNHRGGRHVIGLELARIEPDPHRMFRAEDLHRADALEPREAFDHRGVHVIGQLDRGPRLVGRNQRRHHQEAGGRFLHRHTLPGDGFGQARLGLRQLVLHLHLRDVGIGAQREGERDRRPAGRGGAGFDVAQPVQAGHLLFDHLHHGIGDGFRRSARIGGGNDDGGRGDRGILRHRQAQDRKRPHPHDHQRDDPGEDRPVDEETRHVIAPPPERRSPARRGRSSGSPRKSPDRRLSAPRSRSSQSPAPSPP